MKNIEFIKSLLNKNFYPGMDLLIDLKSNWNFVVQSEISEFCSPFRLFPVKEKFDVFVSCSPSAVLEVRNIDLKTKINLFFGKDFVNKIVVVPVTS